MRFEILVPIWGERYIKHFCDLGLRSVLAPGNLPWLCTEHDVAVTVLTTRASHAVIRAQPAFQLIERIATLSLIDINDLIETYHRNYAIILTRAYNRAMAISQDMLGTAFIYLVGDLVFSDGAFREIAAALDAGHDACLMCSPRVDADVVEPLLMAQGTGTDLALTPRQLAAYLMAFPHPTLAAKVVKGSTIKLSIAHQYFWRPRADTMVARCFLQHMICIRPTRRPIDIAAPCDYAFVTELAPSGRWHYMEDSDRFLVLEMQGTAHEVQFITTHPLDIADLAEALSFWTTSQHHAFSRATFVYRSDESSYTLDEGRRLTDPFVEAIHARLPPPMDHRNHVFWLGALGLRPLVQGMLPPEAALAGPAPAALAERIACDLARRGGDGLLLAVSVTAGEVGAVDAMLGRAAGILVRVEPKHFYRILEDVASPGESLLLVLQGGLRDFLQIFTSREQLFRLLAIAGPRRTLILSFAIERSAFQDGLAVRAQLYTLYAAALGIVEHFGLVARLYDLSAYPLDGLHGFIIEIAADAVLGSAFEAFRPAAQSLLYGRRRPERHGLPEEAVDAPEAAAGAPGATADACEAPLDLVETAAT